MFLLIPPPFSYIFFFFNDTATTEIYTLSLHDALPISARFPPSSSLGVSAHCCQVLYRYSPKRLPEETRSEEHTSELQSRLHLVCRLLLEKKKKNPNTELSFGVVPRIPIVFRNSHVRMP